MASSATEIGYSTELGSFVVGPDGSGPRALSTGIPFNSAGPQATQPSTGPIVVSPDGRKEAFWRGCDKATSSGTALPGVWTANSDGTAPRRVWAAGCFEEEPLLSIEVSPLPRWNAAGTAIAIGVQLEYQFGIVIMDADGTHSHYLLDASDRPVSLQEPDSLAWSPDGTQVAFIDENLSVDVAPIAGGPPRVLVSGGSPHGLLSWSPDGGRLLVTARDGLETIDVSGGATQTLLSVAGGITSALWSPDGSRVAWTSVTGGIGVADADGAHPMAVPDTARLGFTLALTSWFTVRSPPFPTPASSGYWVVDADAGVAGYGDAYRGPTTPPHTSAPITAIVLGDASYGYPSRDGYTLVSAAGQVLNAGPVAAHFGIGHDHSAPIVAACGNDFLTPAGNFYLFGTSDSAPLATTTGLTAPVVAAICLRDNIIFTADGAVYQQQRGGTSAVGGPTILLWRASGLTAPIVGAAADDATGGFWLVGRDGNVYGFDAPLRGTLLGHHLSAPVVGIAPDDATGGYWIVTADGVIHGLDAPTEPQTSGPHMTHNAVGIAAAPFPTSQFAVAE